MQKLTAFKPFNKNQDKSKKMSHYMKNNWLSPHFSLQEFIISQTAARLNIDNYPDSNSIFNLRMLCRYLLEPLRSIVDSPIKINSGFRSIKLNEAVGGAKFSQHCDGKAADINAQNMLPEHLFNTIIQYQLPYDKLILEFNSWIHVSFSMQKNRSITLIADHHSENLLEYMSICDE